MSDTSRLAGDTATFTISDLASEFDVTTRTIRFYEDEGMLAPAREGLKRVFSPRDRTRLRLILRGKRIGLPLAEIKEIVDMYDGPPGEAGQLDHLLGRIDLRVAELTQRRAEIDSMLEELAAVATRAGTRLTELSAASPTAPG
jgi:DNA-binding transcriptional MerR regulator